MSFYRRYSLLVGIFLLACVIVLLLSKPSTMFSREVLFIDERTVQGLSGWSLCED